MPVNPLAFLGPEPTVLSKDKLKDLKIYLIKHTDYLNKETGHVDILNRIFPTIIQCLNENSREGGKTGYGTISYDTFSIWLSRATHMVKLHGSQYPEIRRELSSMITIEIADELYDRVIELWSDSGAPLSNALNEMFSKLISFIRVLKEASLRNSLFEKWTLRTLEIPYSRRVFYFLVELLYKEVDSATFILDHEPTFVRSSLSFIWSNSLSTNIGKSVSMVLCRVHDECNDEKKWNELWQDDVMDALLSKELHSGIEIYLLPHLFKISKSATRQFLKHVSECCPVSTLLGCLTVAQNMSVLVEPFDGDDAIITIDQVKDLLMQDNKYFKITAFKLLVSSPKPSGQIKPYIYDIIYCCVNSCFCEMDIETRNKIIGLLKFFICRIKDSTHKLDRDCRKMTHSHQDKFEQEIKEKKAAIELGKKFLSKLLKDTLFNLKPGSSHQRKAFAFMILLMLIRSGLDSRLEPLHHDKFKIVDYPFDIKIYSSDLLRTMIDNITDDYGDNRADSVRVLSMSPIALSEQLLSLATERALVFLQDMKGKTVDSGARYFSFLFQYYQSHDKLDKCILILKKLEIRLVDGIEHAKNNLAMACFKFNIHGFFLTFGLLFQIIDFKKFNNYEYIDELILLLVQQAISSWKITSEVLQHDSPEGNLPEEIENNYSTELEAQYGKGTQVISSYAWRTLKESSVLLDSLIKNAALDADLIRLIAPLLREQLATIRHRGAFSAVYPTYVSCCLKCKKIPELSSLGNKWLARDLELVTEKSEFITRRSAGIPYLITGNLTANPDLTEKTFKQLKEVAYLDADPAQTMENVNLPQVNAFNCMKAIFIDKALSSVSIDYINDGMQLALVSFESPIWAIRNCAMMLFTALDNRMFSSRKVHNNFTSGYPAKMFFAKFMSIKQTFLMNLKEAAESNVNDLKQIERIFPILTIMGRLEPSPDNTGMDAFKSLIVKLLHSKQWKIREMAARLLPALFASDEDLSEELHRQLGILIDMLHVGNMNGAHGSLLAAIELLKRISVNTITHTRKGLPIIAKNANNLALNAKTKILNKLSDVLSAESFAIILEYFKLLDIFPDLSGFEGKVEQMFKWLEEELVSEKKLDGLCNLAVSEASKVLLKTSIQRYQSKGGYPSFESIVHNCLRTRMYQIHLAVVDFCFENEATLTESEISCLIGEIWDLVERPVWSHVKSKSLDLLNLIFVRRNIELPISLDKLKMRARMVLQSNDNKFLGLACIEALGPIAGKLLNQKVHENGDILTIVDEWLSRVRSLVDDDKEYPERKAALNSLIAFSQTSEIGEKCTLSSTEFEVTFLIFRFLSDDDSELRTSASEYLSESILDVKYTLIPAMAESRMVHWISIELRKNSQLIPLLFDSTIFSIVDPKRKFTDLFRGNELLFSYEKQNLYRDEISSSDRLNTILESMGVAVSDPSVDAFAQIIERNVQDIVNWLDKKRPVDGCFGWTTDQHMIEFVYENLKALATLLNLGAIQYKSQLIQDVIRVCLDDSLQIHPIITHLVHEITIV